MSSRHPKRTRGVLVLEGATPEERREFPGFLFGTISSSAFVSGGKDQGLGEVVFNTSMTGYQEILTDPSYYAQIVCMTYPHIGNTGVNTADPESRRVWAAGFVVHDYCDQPSNWRSDDGSLEQYLIKNGLPGIYGVDTRAVTRHLRSRGVVRGVILPESEKNEADRLLRELPGFEGRDLISEVTCREPYLWPGSEKGRLKVVAIDFGTKNNLLASLASLGCSVEVVPANTSAAEILEKKPDGIFLSNGPGDPSAAPYAVNTVRELLDQGDKPTFGVCMGHQILSLAAGAKTFKLKFGHRGGNQPVQELSSGHVEISSHNHGYAVDADSLPKDVKITHLNLNDRTVEGIEIPSKRAFSVQYHPEACPGPHDSIALFERFVELMKK